MDYISKTTHEGRNVRVKDYKKRVRRNRRRRKILFFSFLLLCFLMFLHLSPIFNIKEIRCVGNQMVSNEEVIATSTISYNYNLFRMSVGKAKKLVETMPYVQNAEVKRKIPNVIEIDITECKVSGYLPLNEGYIYVDDSCRMLEFNTMPPELNVPVIQSTGVLSFEGGKKLLVDDDEKLDLIIAVFKRINSNASLDKITIIDIPTADKLTLYYNNRLQILVGDIKDIDYKINFALRTIDEKLGENAKGFLDVSNPKNGSIYREKK